MEVESADAFINKLNDENKCLHNTIEKMKSYIQELEYKLNSKKKTKMEYKVVRVFRKGEQEELLQEAFDEGYEFVRASEFIPEFEADDYRYFGYIEYILKKEIELVESEDLT